MKSGSPYTEIKPLATIIQPCESIPETRADGLVPRKQHGPYQGCGAIHSANFVHQRHPTLIERTYDKLGPSVILLEFLDYGWVVLWLYSPWHQLITGSHYIKTKTLCAVAINNETYQLPNCPMTSTRNSSQSLNDRRYDLSRRLHFPGTYRVQFRFWDDERFP
jgi:hypothetical protein